MQKLSVAHTHLPAEHSAYIAEKYGKLDYLVNNASVLITTTQYVVDGLGALFRHSGFPNFLASYLFLPAGSSKFHPQSP